MKHTPLYLLPTLLILFAPLQHARAQDLVNCFEEGPSSNLVSRIPYSLGDCPYTLQEIDSSENTAQQCTATLNDMPDPGQSGHKAIRFGNKARIEFDPQVADGETLWRVIEQICTGEIVKQHYEKAPVKAPDAKITFDHFSGLEGSIQKMDENGYTFVFTPSTQSVGYAYFNINAGGISKSVKVYIEVIEFCRVFLTGSELNQKRNKAGIVEKIDYFIRPFNVSEKVEWEMILSNGSNYHTRGTTASAVAPPEKGTMCILGKYDGYVYSNELTIVAPTNYYLEDAKEGVGHIYGYSSVALTTKYYVPPFDVSFEHVAFREIDCMPSLATGLWTKFATNTHGASGWMWLPAPVANETPVAVGKDDAIIMNTVPKEYGIGYLQLDIPVCYTVNGKDIHLLGTAQQIFTSDAFGNVTVTKDKIPAKAYIYDPTTREILFDRFKKKVSSQNNIVNESAWSTSLNQEYDCSDDESRFLQDHLRFMFDKTDHSSSINICDSISTLTSGSQDFSSRRVQVEQWVKAWNVMLSLQDDNWTPDANMYLKDDGNIEIKEVSAYNNRQEGIRNTIKVYRKALELKLIALYAQPPYNIEELDELLVQLNDEELAARIHNEVEKYKPHIETPKEAEAMLLYPAN
ncbi:MAG: hypothetical protein PHP44_00295 [Kiritimatiellae bacterium]|nr:hypothetical protein [Kiritimatiellia bacterium]